MDLARWPALLVVCQLMSCEPTRKPAASDQAPPSLVHARAGSVVEVVAEAQQLAARSGQKLIVYVGATWCEPCEVFLEALDQKALPESLAAVSFLKFDHDKDEARLEAGGYGGQMLPRFVLPGPDGRASEKRFEGSTKESAMDNIIPRLEALLR